MWLLDRVLSDTSLSAQPIRMAETLPSSLLLSAPTDPSVLDQLASHYSDVSAGYPHGLVRVDMVGEKGRGLVAARSIKKGDMVYDAKEGIEVELTEKQLRAQLAVKTPEERKLFLMHCYCHDGALWFVLGIGRLGHH